MTQIAYSKGDGESPRDTWLKSGKSGGRTCITRIYSLVIQGRWNAAATPAYIGVQDPAGIGWMRK